MNLDNASQYVREVLKDAGWFPERKVPVTEWLAYLNRNGVNCTDQAGAILENFGGLRISPPVNPQGEYRPEEIVFDPTFAGRCDVVKEWADDLDEAYCPIGSIWKDRAVFVLSESGVFFGISDQGVHYVGDDLASALEVLIAASSKAKLIHRVEDYA
jgi:hypothetical protein